MAPMDRFYSRFGTSVGGLFLALPAIFCASATLIEKHEIRRKQEAGLSGERRGQMAAALDSAGAALGSLGMLAFAIVFWLTVEKSVPGAFAGASFAWLAVSIAACVHAAQDEAGAEVAGSRKWRPRGATEPPILMPKRAVRLRWRPWR